MTREEKENLLREAVDILIRLDNHLMTSRENAEFSAWVEDLIEAVPMYVIDDIKAEIEQHCCITVGTNNEPAMTLYDIFKILDKHISGKENE